ncbi:uncharacterized protein LOC135081527 [Ostrinia nubilalis]|uniref:uncharacterized protein LOC135081527 n=1 Tax=Ostrinia nubilalis TaxID=29057 RepID=UPI0030824542
MWKYVSRRIRDTFERGANHFDKRGASGVVHTPGNVEEKNKRSCPPCCWFTSRKCWNSFQQGNNTNNNYKWNFEHLTSSWIGAITWSSALVLGWYTSQLIHLKYKYHAKKGDQEKCPTALLSALSPYIKSVNKNITSGATIEQIINHFTPTVHLVSNEQNGEKKESVQSQSSSSTSPDSSDDALGNVLNSIENKLGLNAIENGQLQDGLNLLRSAANRNHAPALYNLGLCYEIGLGVNVDEKVAMEMYRSAAALEHPGALYNLGIYYGQGRGGLVRDTVTATRLLRLAAVQGQQDAIDALKSLDLDTEPQHNNTDTWSYQFNNQFGANNSIMPTPTTLFVENVSYCRPEKYAY